MRRNGKWRLADGGEGEMQGRTTLRFSPLMGYDTDPTGELEASVGWGRRDCAQPSILTEHQRVETSNGPSFPNASKWSFAGIIIIMKITVVLMKVSSIPTLGK